MAYIYIFTNKINNKKYIGQTIDIQRRLKEHERANTDSLFHKSIKKYGWNNFDKFYFCCPKFLLDFVEKILILFLNSLLYKGYNLESGGNKNKHFSDVSKQKMSESRKNLSEDDRYKISISKIGSHLSKETKNKISNALKGDKNPNFGKTLSNETKSKLSILNTGKTLSDETKKKMSESRKGKKHYLYGKHLTDEIKNKISATLKDESNPHNKKVICIETGEVFNSIRNASKKYSFQESHIAKCCRGKRKTTGGFHWMFYEDYLKSKEGAA